MQDNSDVLDDRKGLTSIEATRKWDITRLAARVIDLKKQGYDIISVREGKGFGSYVRYYLGPEFVKEQRRAKVLNFWGKFKSIFQ